MNNPKQSETTRNTFPMHNSTQWHQICTHHFKHAVERKRRFLQERKSNAHAVLRGCDFGVNLGVLWYVPRQPSQPLEQHWCGLSVVFLPLVLHFPQGDEAPCDRQQRRFDFGIKGLVVAGMMLQEEMYAPGSSALFHRAASLTSATCIQPARLKVT